MTYEGNAQYYVIWSALAHPERPAETALRTRGMQMATAGSAPRHFFAVFSLSLWLVIHQSRKSIPKSMLLTLTPSRLIGIGRGFAVVCRSVEGTTTATV
jgi:hypothetical protein